MFTIRKICMYIILLCVFMSFMILKQVLQNQWRADNIRYEMQMQCIQHYINAGIERSAIKLTTNGCEVIK